jgi:SAM-dependent methyltransferase
LPAGPSAFKIAFSGRFFEGACRFAAPAYILNPNVSRKTPAMISPALSKFARNGLAAIILSSIGLVACAQSGDDRYQPQVGQAGKDVVWVPTNNDLVNRMLETAKVTKDDLVFDLGAGDGKIAIAAARNHGARAVGIEFNPEMAALARRNAERAGVADKVTIINGDIFKEDFSKATVVTMYLLPDLNIKLRPTLLKMRPGTRLVTNSFTMGDWEPDQLISASTSGFGGSSGYYWVVPAQVGGDWNFDGMDGVGRVRVNITQKYQKIGGTITLGDKAQPLLDPRVDGAEVQFRYVSASGQLQVVKATFTDAGTLKGQVGSYSSNSFEARRIGN